MIIFSASAFSANAMEAGSNRDISKNKVKIRLARLIEWRIYKTSFYALEYRTLYFPDF
jgi:hypothetical protein